MNKVASEVIYFPENPEIGNFYKVPCVKNLKGEYVPINSYLHEDKKIIGVDFKHWHIDWRFVSVSFWKSEVEWYMNNTTKNRSFREGGIPMVLAKPNGEINFDYNDNTTTFSTQIFYKKRKYKRDYGVRNFFQENKSLPSSWMIKMSELFCGSKLKKDGNKLICPHKGVVIDKNCKDKNGNYICPGHMLRFNPDTLECVRAKEPLAWAARGDNYVPPKTKAN